MVIWVTKRQRCLSPRGQCNILALGLMLAELVDDEQVRAFPDVAVAIEGQNANSAQTMGSILRGFLIGLVRIYVVLSFQFRSYLEPVIVMLTIPLALVGVVLGTC